MLEGKGISMGGCVVDLEMGVIFIIWIIYGLGCYIR